MPDLRKSLIRLAHRKPELRHHLVPLLQRGKEAKMKLPVKYQGARNNVLLLTISVNELYEIEITAKRDQVDPSRAPDYEKKYISAQVAKLKALARAWRSHSIPTSRSLGIGKVPPVAQLARWSQQASWSDDAGWVLVSNDPKFGAYLASFLPMYFPIRGGGVPGSTSYKGTGWAVKGPQEWVWHESSYGIGD